MNWSDVEDRLNRAERSSAVAEEVTYTPVGGGPATVRAVFELEPIDVDPETGVMVASAEPTIEVRVADLPAAPTRGDVVVARGTSYEVAESPPPGGTWALLRLQLA